MKVCTRCKLSDDAIIARLFDEDTPTMPFLEYDPLGTLVMAGQSEAGAEKED
jgi:hypothetical protein